MIKTISFKDNELDLYEYAVENGGLSFVVKKLLREAIRGENTPQASTNTNINVEDLLLLVDQLKNKISPSEEPIKEEVKKIEKVVDPEEVEEAEEEVDIDMGAVNDFLKGFTQ